MKPIRNRLAANRRLGLKLGVTAVLMFGFGFALAPLYDLFCQVTGLNGKTGRVEVEAVASTKVDTARQVTVEFTGNATHGLPWEFRPLVNKLDVHPGETIVVKYYVRNTSNETIVGQAVPSVAPGRAAAYFKKIECFCFSNQKLAPGEAREMPVRFMVMPELAKEVQTITLSYAFFNTDKAQAKRFGGDAAPEGSHAHHQHGAGEG
ncbi:MAG: cytochrome c oxidase assembly protein [Gammaproteobacteria bacterium]